MKGTKHHSRSSGLLPGFTGVDNPPEHFVVPFRGVKAELPDATSEYKRIQQKAGK
jgi:hypothetical protein